MAHLLTQIRGSPVYHKPNMYLYLSITISIKIYTVFIPFCMCSSCDKVKSWWFSVGIRKYKPGYKSHDLL